VKNHDLEAALGLHRKNNKDVSQLLQAVTSQNKNAMMEEDVTEKGKVSVRPDNKILASLLDSPNNNVQSRPIWRIFNYTICFWCTWI